MIKENKSCDMCGGRMVYIRGRYPSEPDRLVCPTCMAETLDDLRERLDPAYGVAYENTGETIGNRP